MTLDYKEITARLRCRPTAFELAALAAAICFGLGLIYLEAHYELSGLFIDFQRYMEAVLGSPTHYYYSFWGRWLLFPFSLIRYPFNLILWQWVNILGVFAACRVFGGKAAALILSYPMAASLYFGNISGLLCTGIALMWLGLAKRSWVTAGIGLTAAAIKPQIGVIAAIVLLCSIEGDIRSPRDLLAKNAARWKALLLPLAALTLSLVLSPEWISQTVARIRIMPAVDQEASITAWRYLGPWGLLALLPPLLLPLDRQRRLVALIAAWLAAAPYFQPSDMAALFMFPLGWAPLLTWIAVPLGWPHPALPLFFTLLLAGVYLRQMLPAMFHFLKPSRN